MRKEGKSGFDSRKRKKQEVKKMKEKKTNKLIIFGLTICLAFLCIFGGGCSLPSCNTNKESNDKSAYIQTLLNEIDELNLQIKAKEGEIAEIQSDMQKLEADKNAELVKLEAAKNAEIAELKKQINALTAEVAELREQLGVPVEKKYSTILHIDNIKATEIYGILISVDGEKFGVIDVDFSNNVFVNRIEIKYNEITTLKFYPMTKNNGEFMIAYLRTKNGNPSTSNCIGYTAVSVSDFRYNPITWEDIYTQWEEFANGNGTATEFNALVWNGIDEIYLRF